MESLVRGFRQSVAIENLVLEINSSKYAYNMSFKEVTLGLAKGILGLAPKIHAEFHEQLTVKVQWEKTKEVIFKLKDLLAHYVKTPTSQKDLLGAIEVR
jgi:translation initiation factor eIF-2B subunit epsilon